MNVRDELQALANEQMARRAALRPAPVVRRRAAPAPLPTEADYRAALASHDWHFERSDDHGAWRAGQASYGRLCAMQLLLDPGRVIWREYAERAAA